MIHRENLTCRHLGVLLLGLFLSGLAAGGYYYSLHQQSVERIQHLSNYYAERTGNFINAVFHKTDVLAAVVKLQHGDISEKTFKEVAPLVYTRDSGIRGIQYMPRGVVTYSYPVEGNEAVIGKNFFEIPERRADVLLAVNTKSIALSGPYHLIQGGLGVVARNPVFLQDLAGNDYFWGFSTIILDLPEALSGVSLARLRDYGLDYQLFCVNENNERLMIEGNPELDMGKAVCRSIKVPHHEWTLALTELSPWVDTAKAGALFLMGTILSFSLWFLYDAVKQKEEAIKAKDRFFSDISHDMRTPLNAVIGFANLGRKEELSAAEKDAYLEKIQTAGQLLLGFINDTLLLSKGSSGKLSLQTAPVSTSLLGVSILETIRALAEQKQITLAFDESGCRTRTILADQLKVQKIFLNLLNNAVKFTPAGGHIWLTVADEASDEISSPLVFTVKDDGIGISPEFLPHLFEPFTQEERAGYEGQGTGLGLAIVKQLVEMMGGSITVDSTVGRGTSFRVCLPLKEAKGLNLPAGVVPASQPDYSCLKGKKVLLCEDNLVNQQIAAALLKREGMLVEVAGNGQLGLEKFAQSKPEEYAAILMDIRMPVLDGYAAARKIRLLERPDAKTVPILAMTADVFSEDVQNCLEAGMGAHIAKPIQPQVLYETLARFLKK